MFLQNSKVLMMELIWCGYLLCAVAYACEQGNNCNKTECVKQLVGWCEGMLYPQQGGGMAMLSITYDDPKGYYRVLCTSDSDGTNCTRNGQPWFGCAQGDGNNTFTYKGTSPSEDVDDDICSTADKAFNELFVQNLSYDNSTLQTELEKSMESFFAQISAMQEQIEQIQRRLSGLPLFWDDPWGGFEDVILFGRPNDVMQDETLRRPKDDVISNETTTGPSNQIERE